MGTRRQARECALQMLYQLDVSGAELSEALERYWAANYADPDVREFAEEIVRGVRSSIAEIDDLLSRHSTNWKLSRMATVDKNVLRIGAYEITRRPDIPVKVAINEAVEIAKRYGTSESGAFVNGILDNIARSERPSSISEDSSGDHPTQRAGGDGGKADNSR